MITLVYRYVWLFGCLALGLIALYSAGIGLIDPKFHCALGFALSLAVAIEVSRKRRSESARNERFPRFNLIIDASLLVLGCWAIWSFYFVQTQMETALSLLFSASFWKVRALAIRCSSSRF